MNWGIQIRWPDGKWTWVMDERVVNPLAFRDRRKAKKRARAWRHPSVGMRNVRVRRMWGLWVQLSMEQRSRIRKGWRKRANVSVSHR